LNPGITEVAFTFLFLLSELKVGFHIEVLILNFLNILYHLKKLGSVRHFFKEMNTFIQQGCIKMI